MKIISNYTDNFFPHLIHNSLIHNPLNIFLKFNNKNNSFSLNNILKKFIFNLHSNRKNNFSSYIEYNNTNNNNIQIYKNNKTFCFLFKLL